MSKYKKFRFEGLAEVYEQCKKMGYTRTYDSMCKIIRKNRKRVVEVIDEKSTYQTAKFLEKLEEKFGFKIKTIQTDNGKEFTNGEDGKATLFELKLKEKGIEYKKTRPYSPWQNGKVERSHREDSKFYLRRKFKSKEALIKSVKKYCSRCNNVSKKVLGFKSPNEVLEEYNKNEIA